MDADFCPINFLLGFQKVDGTGNTPRPGADGSDFPLRGIPVLLIIKQNHDALFKTLIAVCENILIVHCGGGKSVPQDFFKIPAPGMFSPPIFRLMRVKQTGTPGGVFIIILFNEKIPNNQRKELD